MTVQLILLPLFLHVALSLVVLLRAARGSAPAMAATAVEGQPGALAALLFYTLTVLALFTRKADVVFVVLAFVFVALRVAVAFPRLLMPGARTRLGAELASLAVLALMWALFALAVLLAI